jgi:hypothetical protein
VSVRRPDVEAFLLPAVVGGGLGDIEEVRVAGARLAEIGVPLRIYRSGDRALPAGVDGPWDWPPLERTRALRPRAPRAITVSAGFGVTAAPSLGTGPYGRPGPWAPEVRAIERAYGADRVLHLTLEEFARTLTSREQTIERYREGGRPPPPIRSRRFTREAREFHALYRRFRAFDRPNVLHLFAAFVPSGAFQREFPEAVQCGPLWPRAFRRVLPSRGRAPRTRQRWFWYASPSSSVRLAEALARSVRPSRRAWEILVRSPRPMPLPRTRGLRWKVRPPLESRRFRAEFRNADLRIVTGSRTLLEALELGGPFLYFNGALGARPPFRRHRSEKLLALLAWWRANGVAADLRRDLAAFASLRTIGPIVRRARDRGAWRESFPHRPFPVGFPEPFDDAGRLVQSVVRDWLAEECSADGIVRRVRVLGRRHVLGGPAGRGSGSALSKA